ncbi:hypothetical protein [Flavobacterium tegetincola]|uniref:hypothetical protein n=1 Tax=Flavobacterium tegetincola TaxID=150172 RepID=UPI000418D85B|nr:hypothetical protein [Flavobacterium tegetincola]
MNKLIMLIMWCFSLNSFAQQSTELSGYFKENYRTIQLSNQAKRLLFVKTKGDVIIPEWGYYLNLTPADAEKLGLKDILVIATNGENYVPSDTKLQKINAMSLSNLEPYIFIDKHKEIASNQKLIAILKHPKKTDTLNYNSIYNHSDFRLTKQWIDVVDHTDSIIVKGVMYISLSSGECISEPVYDLTPINKLAKDALHYVENLFDLGNTEDWNKAQWQNWYEKTMSEKTDVETLKNTNSFVFPNNFRQDQSKMAIYGKDDVGKKILAVEALRYNVDYFEGHQIISWDNDNAKKSDYYRTDQKQLFMIDAFKSMADDLFVLGKYNNWAHLKYDKNTAQYNIQKQFTIEIPDRLNLKGENEISSVQMGEDLSYVILKNKISKSFFIVAIKTVTGEVLFAKKLTELLPMVKEKDLSFVYLKYGTEIPDGFIFGIRENKKYHLVKISANLSEAKTIETTSMIQNATAFFNKNNFDIINSEDGFLKKISFDTSLSHKLSEIQVVDFKDKYYDEDGIISFDGANYQAFFPFSLPFYSGIKMHTINHQFKPIQEQTVHQFLQVEEPMDDNMVHLLYASKLENQFWLFLKVGTDLHYVKIQNSK